MVASIFLTCLSDSVHSQAQLYVAGDGFAPAVARSTSLVEALAREYRSHELKPRG